MRIVEPKAGVFEGFIRQVPDGEPIVLINLLRYRQRADLPGEELTGRQLYERYARIVEPMLMAVGARPIWRGQAQFLLIGPADERWDEIILVAYPSRAAFEQMVNTPEYRACAGLRTAALEDSRLIAATAPQRIGRIAWSVYKLATRVRRRGHAASVASPTSLWQGTTPCARGWPSAPPGGARGPLRDCCASPAAERDGGAGHVSVRRWRPARS